MANKCLTKYSKGRTKLLELRNRNMLSTKESLWRHKSRALWIENGDENTKYFHNYSNLRKNIKTIWERPRGHVINAEKFNELA